MRLPKPTQEIPIHEWERNTGDPSRGVFIQIGNPNFEYESQDENHIYYTAVTVPNASSWSQWPSGFVSGTRCRTLGYMKPGGLDDSAEFDEDYKIEAEINGEWITLGRYNYFTDPFMGGDFNEAIETYVFYTTEIEDLESELEALRTVNINLVNLNSKIDSEIALVRGVRGAVVDVKNQPTDACIIRIYVGDQTKKREAAAAEIERLLGEGYRPYQTFGISEDLARVLFVKYPEPNDANVAP